MNFAMTSPLANTDQALSWLRKRLTGQAQLSADSRTIQPGDGFLAYVVGNEQHTSDGRAYIEAAFAAGAQAVLYEADEQAYGYAPLDDMPCLGVDRLGWYAGEIASTWYGQPSQKMSVIGVTGTNGKTSCALWVAHALNAVKKRCGVIGTLGSGWPQALRATGFTTPDAIQLQRHFQQFHEQQAQAVVLEVSSHGLAQGRVNGTTFNTAVFTNLTRDHLDYHGDMLCYQSAKQRLFIWPGLQHAIINIDDPVGRQFLRNMPANVNVIAYGIQGTAFAQNQSNWLCASEITITAEGTRFTLTGKIQGTPYMSIIHSQILGYFNVSNLLAVFGVLLTQGVAWQQAVKVLQTLQPAPGRMQKMGGQHAPLVVIDYAHTPDALQQALSTLKPIAQARQGNLWCVFGCGGDRDPGKRAQMGQVAEVGADKIIITSDNPRSESNAVIVQMIKAGLQYPEQVKEIEDRATAILYAVRHASKQDVILVAGKGHETWQEINGKKIPFDDTEHVHLALTAIGANP